jgi:hypothetical protein
MERQPMSAEFDQAIIEAAARALGEHDGKAATWDNISPNGQKFYRALARSMFNVIAPLIEAATLERAANAAIEADIADAIRALIPTQTEADEK